MKTASKDEIDIQELATNLVRFFRRRFKFILIWCSAGSLLGLAYYLISPPIYESEMIVMSDILNASYADRLTVSLSRLIKERNDTTLANRLNISINDARQLQVIQVESVDKAARAQERSVAGSFTIKAEVKELGLFPKLQEGLIAYFRNNEFVKARVEQRVQTYRTLIAKLDQEIKSLDSLKARLLQGKAIYSSSTEVMLVDPTNIYSKIIELNKQQIEYKNSLELFNSVQLIEGFTPFKKPASPKLSVALVVGFALGFFGAIGLLTLRQLLKMARESGSAAA